VLRRVGIVTQGANEAFQRQMAALLGALRAVEAPATFFILGLTAENHPQAVETILAEGHGVACHGYAHERVYDLTVDSFRHDLDRSLRLIERLTGRRPRGYRAPCFSINRDSLWARDVLTEFGFEYDSSECECPWVPRSMAPRSMAPQRVGSTSGMWELPVASVRIARRSIPVGGASYWRWMPSQALVRALHSIAGPGTFPALYLHPYEFDPQPLGVARRVRLSRCQRLVLRGRASWRNARHETVLERFAAVAANFKLVTCEDALDDLAARGRPA
jgi:polysaccharide deacetylase family protein (PEP-CTERM system associated)